MRASNVEAHRGNRGHEKDTRIVRSGIMELLEDPVPLLHAMVPVQQLHLDSGVAKDLEGLDFYLCFPVYWTMAADLSMPDEK